MRHRDNIDGIPYLHVNEVTNNNNIVRNELNFSDIALLTRMIIIIILINNNNSIDHNHPHNHNYR